MKTEKVVHSDLPIPPGEYLEEVIGSLGMTKDELARRMGRPASKLSPIFKGEKSITPETALQLEKVVGVPAHIWLDLESEYRLTLARMEGREEEAQLKREAGLVSAYCYRELVKVRAVPARTKPLEKVLELQKFFGVASLLTVPEMRLYEPVFRLGKTTQKRTPQALVAWLRLGELRARDIPCKPFDAAALRGLLPELRGLTKLAPEAFQTRLSDLLASAGVILVIIPHFLGTGAHGATFRLTREKMVLMLTIRGRWADIFWFSLFHEIGHILLHGRQEVIVEDEDYDPQLKEREEEADAFARDILIPPAAYKRFIARGDCHPEAIRAFAREVAIDVGIVVGRLQHDAHLEQEWHNGMRARYTWAEPAA